MQHKKLRPEFELSQQHLLLVGIVKSRLGLVASATLTCFCFGEIPRLCGISDIEVSAIKAYAEELGVELPAERTYRMLSR